MKPNGLKKLGDLIGQDLAGWEIAPCYYMELKHELMGHYPAVVRDGEEMKIVVVLDTSLLKKVWGCLERRPAEVLSKLSVVNPTNGIAFMLDSYDRENAVHVFSAEEIEELCHKEGSFKWAPGLLTPYSGAVRDPNFS